MNGDMEDIKKTLLQLENLVSQTKEISKINGDMRNILKLGYSKKEAASALSLSKRSIDSLINKGVLKTVRSGNRVIIQAESLKRFMKVGAVPYPEFSRKKDPLQP